MSDIPRELGMTDRMWISRWEVEAGTVIRRFALPQVKPLALYRVTIHGFSGTLASLWVFLNLVSMAVQQDVDNLVTQVGQGGSAPFTIPTRPEYKRFVVVVERDPRDKGMGDLSMAPSRKGR